MLIIESLGPKDTERAASSLGEKASAGEIYLLSGELGAGKTVFAKGFAIGLGVKEYVTSPTFTIMNIYEGKLPLYHFDMYRIEDADELFNIGCDEYFYGNGVCLVEWPEMASDILPSSAVRIRIVKDSGENSDYRLITIETPGEV